MRFLLDRCQPLAISSRVIEAKQQLDRALPDVSANQGSTGVHEGAIPAVISTEADLPAFAIGILLTVMVAPTEP